MCRQNIILLIIILFSIYYIEPYCISHQCKSLEERGHGSDVILFGKKKCHPGTYYTHEDKIDLMRIVDPYMHEVV